MSRESQTAWEEKLVLISLCRQRWQPTHVDHVASGTRLLRSRTQKGTLRGPFGVNRTRGVLNRLAAQALVVRVRQPFGVWAWKPTEAAVKRMRDEGHI